MSPGHLADALIMFARNFLWAALVVLQRFESVPFMASDLVT